MSDARASILIARTEVALGVLWFVWGAKGFWWGVLYALCWETWVGYRLAAWLFAR